MTVDECKAALDVLDETGFETFRRDFGGDFATRRQYVDDFINHPEHERRLCQLLGLTTEQDKRTSAEQDALSVAKEANRIALDANAYSASANEAARRANTISRKANRISWLALGLSVAALAIQTLCGFRHAS